MIHTRYAFVAFTDYGCETLFTDGATCPAQAHHDDFHYRVVSHRLGYEDDTLTYCRHHELAHLICEEMIHNRPSRVLWGLAHGQPLEPHDAAYEECMAQALQRYVRANEQPIIGGVDWGSMKARFLEVLSC